MKIIQKLSLCLLVVSFLVQCGSSSDDLQGKYSVTDVNILANDINIGEKVRVEVFFETKTEFDGTPDGVDVVVRIPSELEFVLGSSQIYDNSTDNTDTYTPDNVVRCPSGETYLVYNFRDGDLFERELDTQGNFGFRFEARGVSKVSATFVGASAGSNETFDCGGLFEAEENEAVEVL